MGRPGREAWGGLTGLVWADRGALAARAGRRGQGGAGQGSGGTLRRRRGRVGGAEWGRRGVIGLGLGWLGELLPKFA